MRLISWIHCRGSEQVLILESLVRSFGVGLNFTLVVSITDSTMGQLKGTKIIGLAEQKCQDRVTRTGQSRLDGQNKTAGTGVLGWDNWDRTRVEMKIFVFAISRYFCKNLFLLFVKIC